ncbi:MAG: B3/4 domain-containing protein, partial [Firmicutes bacterium]|nr:B3/4 domain-containing protein [Bacillota bacterium]
MKKFVLEKDFLEIFPDAEIGILVVDGIDCHVKDENKYAGYLKECQQIGMKYVSNQEFTENPVIRTWRDAFYKFKTKKGARCSIEALLKRISRGDDIGTIIPLVDIYNGISLKYGMPLGGEDIDKFEGDLRLTLAKGGEEFITYGSDGKSEPPYEGEVCYLDNAGAVCRCWNWRESVRTMLTEDTTKAFMIIEAPDNSRHAEMEEALTELADMITRELGG